MEAVFVTELESGPMRTTMNWKLFDAVLKREKKSRRTVFRNLPLSKKKKR